jgi:hypothetical protein
LAAIPDSRGNGVISAQVAEHGIAPAWLRHKFWRLIDSIHQEIAAEAGVAVLPPPPGTRDLRGFRLPEFYGTDWIHANTDYGELVLRQCDAALAGSKE